MATTIRVRTFGISEDGVSLTNGDTRLTCPMSVEDHLYAARKHIAAAESLLRKAAHAPRDK